MGLHADPKIFMDDVELGNENTRPTFRRLFQESSRALLKVRLPPPPLSRLPAGSLYHLVIVDGNICSGKTTYLNGCRESPHVRLVREPIEEWRPHLQMLHDALTRSDSGRTTHEAAANLEDVIFRHHAEVLELRRHVNVIAERGLASQVHVFCKVLCETGHLSREKYDEMRHKHQALSEHNFPDAVLYIEVAPEEAQRRCEARSLREGRDFEQGLPLDYFVRVHEAYEVLYRVGTQAVVRVSGQHGEQEIRAQVAMRRPILLGPSDDMMNVLCVA